MYQWCGMAWKRLPLTDEARTGWRAAKQTKFFVDESLGPEVTTWLREKGLNVRDVFEERLIGRSDEDIMAFAWRTKRVLLTHDHDFLNNRRFPEHRNPGVIILPGGDGDQTAMAYGMVRVVSVFAKDPEVWRHQKILVTINDIPGSATQRYHFARDGRLFRWEN
jgi:predicted nuclease of predicted toxin-antitoxin system